MIFSFAFSPWLSWFPSLPGLHIEYIALLLLVPSTIASALSTMKGALMPDLPSTRERLVSAAFELFEERGYEATSVDDIATRAGVGRTTAFRQFGSKEALIFPDHEALLRRAD